MSRTILIKSAFEFWAEATTQEELLHKVKETPNLLLKSCLSPDTSFRIRINGFNKTYRPEDTMSKINYLVEGLGFQGTVNLSNPEHSIHLLEYYGKEGATSTEQPYYVYLGRWICDGQRNVIKKYDLKKRHFIGNTSMDNLLSMLMANMAQVKESDFVFDPFVGTGSLLVSSAHFGAYVLGTDINWQIIHGAGKSSRVGVKYRGNNENIRANLQSYGMEHLYIDVLIADSSKNNLWRSQSLFDAIITDPPYGIREGSKQISGSKQTDTEPQASCKFPKKEEYQLSEIFKDLLNFAAKFLRLNGRLVYWLPVYIPEYKEDNVPKHVCFQQISNCEQVLVHNKIARRLITMEKIKEDSFLDDGVTVASDHFKESFRERYFLTPEEHLRRNQEKLSNDS